MTDPTGLTSKEVVDSTYERLETLFKNDIIKNFEKETSLTPLLEYGHTKEEFYCSGFIFRTETESSEIIFTARRVVKDDIGIEYGLRWCSCGPIEDLDSFKLEDHIGFQNTRRWVLAKPYREQLLALGENVPREYKIKAEGEEKIYSPDLVQQLVVEILVDRIRKI